MIGHGHPLRPSTTKKSWLPPIVALKVENAYRGRMGWTSVDRVAIFFKNLERSRIEKEKKILQDRKEIFNKETLRRNLSSKKSNCPVS